MTAEPMAKPFVTALVVLPTASRLTSIRSGLAVELARHLGRCRRHCSATGPEGVLGDDDAGGGQHAHAAQGDQVRENWRFRRRGRWPPEGDGDADDGVDGRLQPGGDTRQDRRAGPVRAATAMSLTGEYSVR